MENYLNKDGDSGVQKYEIDPDSIKLIFQSPKFLYTYDYIQPGEDIVEEMKKRALEGRGLNTYINQHVKKNYHFKTPIN